jgi:DNA-directed RNA polymerase subunit K/omega
MDEIRATARTFHPEVHSVRREDVSTSSRTTLPYFSDYEFCALVGARMEQLSQGAKPLVSLEGMNTSDPKFIEHLATKEIMEQKLPMIIHRRLPNGTSEYWSVNELSRIR